MKKFSILLGIILFQSCHASEVTTSVSIRSQEEWDKELVSAVGFPDVSRAIRALQHKASPQCVNEKGETPLMLAVEVHSIQLIKLLISARANPYMVDYKNHDMRYFVERGSRMYGYVGAAFIHEGLRKSIISKMQEDGHIQIFLPKTLADIVIEYCEGSMLWGKRHDDALKIVNRMNQKITDWDVYCLLEDIRTPDILNLDAKKNVEEPSLREMIEAAAKKHEDVSGKNPQEVFIRWTELEELMGKQPKSKKVLR
ncbi:MAG: hypothetical protein ACHQVS_01445 [Candidatus Babeliales bacterium]